MNAALKQDDVRARLMALGIEIQGGTPGDFAQSDPGRGRQVGADRQAKPASRRNSSAGAQPSAWIPGITSRAKRSMLARVRSGWQRAELAQAPADYRSAFP